LECSGGTGPADFLLPSVATAKCIAEPFFDAHRKAAGCGSAEIPECAKHEGLEKSLSDYSHGRSRLLNAAANEQRLIDPDHLTDELDQLPATAWPYGRVVAVAESAASSDDDKARLRKNRAVVAGTLESLQVQIDWVSSP
jgi:hypothetical protein